MPNSVTFIAPSYLLFHTNGLGISEAVAVFTTFSTNPPTIKDVTLPKDDVVEVGGGKIGGPALTQLDIYEPPHVRIASLYPESSLTTGPEAFGVFLPSSDSDGYDLHVLFEGEDHIVKFASV
jgi:hypothetical protein